MTPTIFLDIDGVLNGHEWCHLGHLGVPSLNAGPVRVFNEIARRVDPDVVIHSTWSGKLITGALTLPGFQWMLQSHGLVCRVTGHVNEVPTDIQHRKGLISDYIAQAHLRRFVVIDDLDLSPLPQVRPHPSIGLEPRHVREVIEKLEIC